MAAVGRLSRDWADTIDMATMHPEARRRVAFVRLTHTLSLRVRDALDA
jgi:hypothetical protein